MGKKEGYLHFTNEETQAERDEVIWPRSPSESVTELGTELSCRVLSPSPSARLWELIGKEAELRAPSPGVFFSLSFTAGTSQVEIMPVSLPTPASSSVYLNFAPSSLVTESYYHLRAGTQSLSQFATKADVAQNITSANKMEGERTAYSEEPGLNGA